MKILKCVLVLLTASAVPTARAYDYECNLPLLYKAALSATSSSSDRGPNQARLNGEKAWTAGSSDNYQYLMIDLGQVKNVTSIVTQGRPNYAEFVKEYTISYGTNNRDYVDYKEAGGNVKVKFTAIASVRGHVGEPNLKSKTKFKMA